MLSAGFTTNRGKEEVGSLLQRSNERTSSLCSRHDSILEEEEAHGQ